MHYIILFMAKYAIIAVGLIAAIYWLTLPKKDKIRFVIFGIIAGLVGLILVKVGGAIFYDTRPFVLHNVIPIYPSTADNGFPSDHTALATVIAVTVYMASKRLGLKIGRAHV